MRAALLVLLMVLTGCARHQGPEYGRYMAERRLKAYLYFLREGLDHFRRENDGRCPERLQDLVGAGLFRAIPNDPYTKTADSWIYVRINDGSCELCDVRSGEAGVAQDGTRYSSW